MFYPVARTKCQLCRSRPTPSPCSLHVDDSGNPSSAGRRLQGFNERPLRRAGDLPPPGVTIPGLHAELGASTSALQSLPGHLGVEFASKATEFSKTSQSLAWLLSVSFSEARSPAVLLFRLVNLENYERVEFHKSGGRYRAP